MIIPDASLTNTIVGKPEFYVHSVAKAAQHPPSELYMVDSITLSRKNLPPGRQFVHVQVKQVVFIHNPTDYFLEQEFHSLVERWKKETFAVSSLSKIYAHPAYQRIMAMGTIAIPFVLEQLQKNEGNWFYALKFMAGKDVSVGMTNFEDARAAWLEWGYTNNYI